MYKNCSECQKQFLYTTCSPRVWAWNFRVLNLQFNEQSGIILWVSWCKNKSFWQRFISNYGSESDTDAGGTRVQTVIQRPNLPLRPIGTELRYQSNIGVANATPVPPALSSKTRRANVFFSFRHSAIYFSGLKLKLCSLPQAWKIQLICAWLWILIQIKINLRWLNLREFFHFGHIPPKSAKSLHILKCLT